MVDLAACTGGDVAPGLGEQKRAHRITEVAASLLQGVAIGPE